MFKEGPKKNYSNDLLSSHDSSPNSYTKRNSNDHVPVPCSTHSALSPEIEMKIQRHLEAGNPLYMGIDQTNPLRDSSMKCPTEDKGRRCAGRKAKGGRKILMVATCGMQLDWWAKLVTTAGMLAAGLQMLNGINTFIQNRNLDKLFNVIFAAYQIIWGILFFAICLFGMMLMYGKWRRSPTAALVFTISWALVTVILIVTAFLWFYFFATGRSRLVEACRSFTNTSSTLDLDVYTPLTTAPEEQIESCIRQVMLGGRAMIVWGTVYTLLFYAGVIVVFWGHNYRRRLADIKAREKWILGRKEKKCSAKVGLVMGTAPMGILGMSLAREVGKSYRTIGPRKASLEKLREESASHSPDTFSAYTDPSGYPSGDSIYSYIGSEKRVFVADEPPRGMMPMKQKNSAAAGRSPGASPTSSGSSNLFKALPPPPKLQRDSAENSSKDVAGIAEVGLGISARGRKNFASAKQSAPCTPTSSAFSQER